MRQNIKHWTFKTFSIIIRVNAMLSFLHYAKCYVDATDQLFVFL